jgi:hypothetical protein
MARIRSIKPEFWEDEAVGQISHAARLLFIGTWTLADDQGLLRWTPAYLRAALFMYDDMTLARARELSREVEEAGLVTPYEANGEQLAQVRNFSKHQRIDRPSPAKLPAPDLQCNGDSTDARERSTNVPRDVVEGSHQEGKGREGKGEGTRAVARSRSQARGDPQDRPAEANGRRRETVAQQNARTIATHTPDPTRWGTIG